MITPSKKYVRRVVLSQRGAKDKQPMATLALEVRDKLVTVRAALYTVNRTPFALEMVRDDVVIPLGPAPVSDPSFLPFTPIILDANTVIHQSPKQATPTPSVDAQRAFRSKVLSLEQQLAALRRPFPQASSEASSEAPCFSCWVASPMNQKQWYHVACSENMTFEDLWKRVMANLQGPASPRLEDFYFLWVVADRVVRVMMGEYLSNYKEFPRFLLRHKYHGIRGCVVKESIRACNVESLFSDEPPGEEGSLHYGVLTDDWMRWSVRVKGSEAACTLSSPAVQEKGLLARLSTQLVYEQQTTVITLPLSIRMTRIGPESGIVIEPQHVVFNQTSFPFVIKECSSSYLYKIPAGTRSILCLQHCTPDSQFQLRRESSEWQYSGVFSLQSGVSSILKLRNTRTHEILILHLTVSPTPSFLLVSFVASPDITPLVFQNFCPFPVTLEQSGQQQEVPAYSKFNLIETSNVVAPKLRLATAKGEEVISLDKAAAKRLSLGVLVTNKEECLAVADVYINSRGKWHYRTARLMDHALLLYRKAKLAKRVTGGHSSLSLALPLRNCAVKYESSAISLTASKSALLRLALQCSPLLPSAFPLHQLQATLLSFQASSKTAQIIQDLLAIGILYQLPQDGATPITLQQDPLYAFRKRPIAKDCSITLVVIGVSIQLFFTSSEIAQKWAKLIRFEIDTATPFSPQNWLGARRNHCELRDVDCMNGCLD